MIEQIKRINSAIEILSQKSKEYSKKYIRIDNHERSPQDELDNYILRLNIILERIENKKLDVLQVKIFLTNFIEKARTTCHYNILKDI